MIFKGKWRIASITLVMHQRWKNQEMLSKSQWKGWNFCFVLFCLFVCLFCFVFVCLFVFVLFLFWFFLFVCFLFDIWPLLNASIFPEITSGHPFSILVLSALYSETNAGITPRGTTFVQIWVKADLKLPILNIKKKKKEKSCLIGPLFNFT